MTPSVIRAFFVVFCLYFIYSYLNDSIGSSLEAFKAGYKPANKPTIKQTVTPNKIHAQGIINVLSKAIEIPKPAKTPKKIPTKPPI